MKPRLFESLMQKDGEFKEHVENLRHRANVHPFLKRYCEVGVREGLFSDAEARTFNSAMMVVSVMGMFMRTSAGVAVAQKVYAAATAVAAAVQNSLNISFATFLALTGVGIGVIVAAAAAMWSFADSMNSATASVKDFNEASAAAPMHVRSIQRAGEDELYRRGVE
jgi:hypothetical protein